MRIYDCFTFFNELDILEIRFEEHYETVDRFVLVEADVTQNNRSKPLVFEANKARFARFLDKIVHIIVTDMPREPGNPWVREKFQREQIMRGLTDATPDDLIIIGDVDEILSRATLSRLRQGEADIYGLYLRLYQLRLNYLHVIGPEARLVWPIALRRRLFESPQKVRERRFTMKNGRGTLLLKDAGWHYSSIGDDEHVKNKIRNCAHQEFNTESFLAKLDLEEMVRSRCDPYFRPGYYWAAVPIGWSAPQCILDNADRWARLIAPATGSLSLWLAFKFGRKRTFSWKLDHVLAMLLRIVAFGFHRRRF